MDKVRIRSRGTGFDTSVEVNGVPLTCAELVKFQVTATGMAEVVIHMCNVYVDIDADANVEIEER